MAFNGVIDNIQVEKANAIARYRLFNNISNMFRAIEVFIALALISWSSTRLPDVLKVSGAYIYACSYYLLNQHVVFLLGNVIVVVCYILSSHQTELVIKSDCSDIEVDIEVDINDKGNESGSCLEPEVFEENQFGCLYIHKTIKSVSNIEQVPVEVVPDTKNTSTDEVLIRNEYADVNLGSEMETDAGMVIKRAVKQIKRFQRTQSAKLSMEISTKPRRELRRSVTERRAAAGDGDSKTMVETVERLSNEEFRLAVEAFISKQQSLLKQQGM